MELDPRFREARPYGITEMLQDLLKIFFFMRGIPLDLAARTELSASVDEICTDLSRGIALVLADLREARTRLGANALFDSDEVNDLLVWIDARLDEDLRRFRISRRLRSATDAYLNPEALSNRPGVPKRRYEVVDPIHPAARTARKLLLAGPQKRLRQVLDRLEQDDVLLFREIEARLTRSQEQGGTRSGAALPFFDDLISQFRRMESNVERTRRMIRMALDVDES